MASSGEAGVLKEKEGTTTTTTATTATASSSPSPRPRGDSITDDDPWIANNKRSTQEEEKTGGRGGLPGVLSPLFLKRSKRSESASRDLKGAMVSHDKQQQEKGGKSGKKKRSGVSADDLVPVGRRDPTAAAALDEPKSPRGRARGQLLRSFSQTAVVDPRNKAELSKRERLKKSGEVSISDERQMASIAAAAAAVGSQRSPRSVAAASHKNSPRFHSFSQQEKKEFEQKIKGSNIQFYRNTKKKSKAPIYRNVLEGTDQPLLWSLEDVDLSGVGADGGSEDEDDEVSERRRHLRDQQCYERRGSESSDPGSDYDEAPIDSPKATGARVRSPGTSPQVPVLSPRSVATSPKASYLTPEQLKEMVRERKLEIKRERDREKREKEEREREEKEKAKRDEKERKEREKEERKQQKQAAIKRTHSKGGPEDQPFPGILLANDKLKSLLEREPTPDPSLDEKPTTPRRPSEAAEEYMESPRFPPPLTLSQGGAVALLTTLSSADSAYHASQPTSPTSPHKSEQQQPQQPVALPSDHQDATQQKEQHRKEQEQREKQLKLEAERRKKYKKQISIHLGMSKQQRRSRSFSDLTHYFTDQPNDGANAQGRKKEKKEKKDKKKEKKENKKEKKDKQAAATKDPASPVKPVSEQQTATEVTPPAGIKPVGDKEQAKNDAAGALPRIPVATGKDREQELREIREMLSFRKKDNPSTTAGQQEASPSDRKTDREHKRTLYRSNSEQHLKLLTAKIPSMLLQEKINGGKGLKSHIVLSRPERELIDRQVDMAEKLDVDMNRGKNGSRVRKRGDKVAKDRLRTNATGADSDSSGDEEDEGEGEEARDEQNQDEGQEQRVFVQVQRGQVFGMTLDEVMRLQQSSTSPPTSPQPSPSLPSPLSASPMSCSPPGSPLLGMSNSMSSVNTASAVHFSLSKDEAKLPVVLTALANGILELGGTQMTGLFRVPGKKSTMDVIRDRLNSGIYQFEEGTCPHDLASLLKEWLKSITPPLIPLELYDRCVDVSGRPNECVEVIEKSLPDLNKRIIKYVVRFLQQQILSPEVQRATRMDIRSIATAFAPCFLDNPILSMEELVKNIQAHIKFMVNLLMLLNVNVGKISSNSVPVRKGGREDDYDDDPSVPDNNNEESESSAKEHSEGSRIIPKMVNDRFKRWQERSKTKGSASARVTRGERKRSIEKKE